MTDLHIWQNFSTIPNLAAISITGLEWWLVIALCCIACHTFWKSCVMAIIHEVKFTVVWLNCTRTAWKVMAVISLMLLPNVSVTPTIISDCQNALEQVNSLKMCQNRCQLHVIFRNCWLFDPLVKDCLQPLPSRVRKGTPGGVYEDFGGIIHAQIQIGCQILSALVTTPTLSWFIFPFFFEWSARNNCKL